jgi:hypothetical protein
MATVNIGLAVNGAGKLNAAQAIAALRTIGGEDPICAAIHDSDTEPTLVAQLARPLNAAAAYEVARSLGQDAIAQWDRGEGQLIGPNAAAWGLFNPAFFLTIDGSRLDAAGLRLAA